MDWLFPSLIFGLSLTTALSVAITLYAWRRRQAPGARPFAVFMLAVAIWSCAAALELNSAAEASKIFWLKVSYLGIVILPAAWLIFALQYSGHESWVHPRTLALLALEPLVILLLIWTNDSHHLFWLHIVQQPVGAFYVLIQVHRPAFWFNLIYIYFLIVTGIYLMLRTLGQRPAAYRSRAGAMLITMLLPLLISILSRVGPRPLPYLPLTPLGFLFANVLVFWGVIRFRFLEIMPLAHQTIVEGMSDGLAILDTNDRIVYLNPAACGILNRPAAELLGKPASQIVPSWPTDTGAQRHTDTALAQIHKEITLDDGKTKRHTNYMSRP